MTPSPAEDDPTFLDLVDDLLAQLLDGEEPDLAATASRHPDVAHRVAEAAALATRVAGRRSTSRPSMRGYEIARELGRGGMGTVYLARQSVLDREVALKVLPQSFGLSARSRQRFLHEARALAKVQHPNIVAIHRIVDDGDVLAFEMEFVDGPSLQHLLDRLRAHRDRTHLAPTVAQVADVLGRPLADLGTQGLTQFFVRLGAKVARALSAAHAAGLIHRDVKPANILLRRNAEPVLVDFGLVRLAEHDLSRVGGFAGTPAYSAPEQLRGDATIGPPADVYGLAATLYECLTLATPFPNQSTTALLKRIESGRCAPLRRLAPSAPRDLETILAHAMEVDPAQRYADAGALADDLQRLLDLQPIHAHPAGPVRRFAKMLRRQRTPLLAGCLGAALVVAAIVPFMEHVEASRRDHTEALEHVRAAQQHLISMASRRPEWRSTASDGATSTPLRAGAGAFAPLHAAVAEYERACALDPTNAAAQRERDIAKIALWLRQLVVTDAATLHRALDGEQFRALTASVGPFTVRGARSLALGTTDASEAIADLGGASTEDLATLGLLGFLLGDFRLCEKAWQAPRSSLHDQPLVDAALGIIQRADGMPDLAYLHLQQARRHFHDSATLTLELAEVAVALGDANLAHQWLHLLGADPASASVRQRLELDLRGAIAPEDELVAGYRQLAEADPTDPTPRHRLAQIALRRGDLPRASRELDGLVADWPDVSRFRLDRARVALQQHDLAAYARQALAVLDQDYGRHRSRGTARDLLEILRIGGLTDLYRAGLVATDPGRTGRPPLGGETPVRGFLPAEAATAFEELLPLLHDVRCQAAAARRANPLFDGVLGDVLVTLPTFVAHLPILAAAELVLARLVVAATPQVARAAYPHFITSLVNARMLLTALWKRVPVLAVDAPTDLPDAVRFANTLLRIDDCTGDGIDEVLVGAVSMNPPEAPGRIFLVDGAAATVADTLVGDSEGHMFGQSLAAIGDVDGDGQGDWLIGCPSGSQWTNHGTVEVWSGSTRRYAFGIEGDNPGFGVAVAGLGDVDADGVPDFAVATAPSLLNTAAQGSVQVFSGRSRQVLHTMDNEAPGVWFGASIANVGDADGDGVADLVVGGNYGGAPGVVRLHSGRTGRLLQSWSDPSSTSGFGTVVIGAGDADGDGRSDVAVSAVRADTESGCDQVFVFSGATGQRLAAISGDRAGIGFGSSMALYHVARGPAWLAIGVPAGETLVVGSVQFWTTRGQKLATVMGPKPLSRFGAAIALSSDDDGDGLPEVFVAASEARRVWRIGSRQLAIRR